MEEVKHQSNRPKEERPGKGHVPKACVDDPNGILCAINTGYLGTLVHKKRMYNPLDDLLVDLARSFPLDLFLLGVCSNLSCSGIICGANANGNTLPMLLGL